MSLFDIGSFAAGGGAFVVLFLIAKLIKVEPVKVHPLQAIGKSIGKAINGEVIIRINGVEKSVKEIEGRMESLEKRQEAYETKSEMGDMDIHRSNILKAADEVSRGIPHSREFYEQLMIDIKVYKRFCKNHPDYENSKAEKSIELLETRYTKHLEENSFL